MCKKYHDDEYTLITINKCKLHNLYYDSFYTKYKINLYTDWEHDKYQKDSIKYYREIKIKKMN